MIRLPKALFIAVSSLATTGVALAQGEGDEEEATEEAPSDDAAPEEMPEAGGDGDGGAAPGAGPAPLTLGAGKIVIGGSTVNINLSADAVAKPFSLAPSVWYGVNEKLTVGLTHDGGSTQWTPRPALRTFTIDVLGTPFTAAAGAGICLTGEENGCPKVYDNVGVDALYALKEGKFSLAAHPALDIFSFDPFALSLRAGVLGRYMASDKIAVVFDPRLKIGLTERDFNKEALDIPVWLWYAVNDKVGAYVHTGISGPLDGFGDAFSIPVQVGANFTVNEKLTAGADFSFLNLLGKGSTADSRALGLRVIYAL